ncbi:LURP-one-related/scramblase family protein [Dolosigranulum pigrum]|jgi:uncharacterized protein yxjI|uniref:LURP-one-related family protein n=2 Tax=Dolosigranulum pigrum TaxID=29394 RepID=A0A1S8KP42_9LACT|nr:LURP-one-related family protein [Dolosigranulum pigrum]OOL81508.1 hypothetical protein BWX42_07195 [Dolosigranulum pigrum]QTJ59167.1 hypothetical protein FE336_08120 [Dolosigranulum pigrum]
MIYHIKQKMLSFKDEFTIYNAQGQELFYVEEKLLSFGKKFFMRDREGREVLSIEEKVLSLLATYEVYIGGQLAATVKKDVSFFRPKYTIQGLDWEIQGDFLAHDYRITEDGRTIANVSKAYLSWSDTYQIDIVDEEYADVLLGIVIVIDAVLAQNRRNN